MKSIILRLVFLFFFISQFNLYSQWTNDPKINSILMNMVNIRKYDAVLPLNNGGEIVAWLQGDYIYAQRLNANGKKLWKPDGIFIEKNNEGEWVQCLKIVDDCLGGAILFWQKYYLDWQKGTDIFAQRIDSVGNLKWAVNGIKVCLYPIPCNKYFSTSNSVKNAISDGAGGAIITWQDYRDPNGYYNIYAQRINSSGELIWNSDGIPTGIKSMPEPEYYHEIVSSGDGGAIICGRKLIISGIMAFEIYVQKIDNSGNVKWKANGVPISTTFSAKHSIRIISDGLHGAMIYWCENDPTSLSVHIQKINSDGILQWPNEGVVALRRPGYSIEDNIEDLPNNIISDGSGGAYTTFCLSLNNSSDYNQDVFAQKINSSGTVEWANNGIPISTEIGTQGNCLLSSDGSGGIITTWLDRRSNNGLWNIYAQRVNSSGIIQWQVNGIYLCPYSFLDIIYPIENEVWTIGTKPKIRWWTRNYYSSIKIEFSIDSGVTWKLIKQNIPDSVREITDWEVPNTPSTKCKIRISDTGGSGVTAVSDGFFTIAKPSFSFTCPIGGEVWKAGANPVIKWSSLVSTSLVKFVNIDLSTDGGSNWIPIFKNTPNDGKVRDWTVPNLPSSQCKLRISDPTGKYLAVSNGYFTILGPSIQIVSPAGGEVWKAGSNPILKWNSTALSKYVNIDISSDGGATWWQAIGNTPDDGMIRNFSVPNFPSTKCKIRISDISGNPSAVSNGYFTIVGASIQLISPANGDVLQVGTNPIIKWKSTSLSKFVNIFLSTDGGNGWYSLFENTPDDGQVRDWIVPDFPSTKCKLMISAVSGTLIGVNSGYFTITKSLNKSVTQLSSEGLPKEFALNQNFPNPFNPETKINYQIPDAGSRNSVFVQLRIYDIVGREITTLVNEEQSPGIYQVSFDGSSLPSGVYIYRLSAGEFTSIKKMILTK